MIKLINLVGILIFVHCISCYEYKVKYFNTYVDHFSYAAPKETFKLRYLISEKFWTKGNVILFYTGNEGDIITFADNTGFLWEQAEKLGGLVVFAEHRYYGESLPFGNKSFSTVYNRGFLSASQALADYALLVKFLKSSLDTEKSPVIALGGSYGGMLAGYFRAKYPNLVAGALASSAPIAMVGNTSPSECGDTFAALTLAFKVMNNGSLSCPANVNKAWPAISKLGQTKQGRQTLGRIFKTCVPIPDPVSLIQSLTDILFSMGMINYPYPTNFLVPIGAWPVKQFCRALSPTFKTDLELLEAFSTGIQIYTNYTGKTPCNLLLQSPLQALNAHAWEYQTCTELPLPMCMDGKHDMFFPDPFNQTQYDANCQNQFQVSPRWNWGSSLFLDGHDLRSLSNVIFTNGGLDPWSGGGVLPNRHGKLNPSVHVWLIPLGAHHLDLRESNPADPLDVKAVRIAISHTFKKWISMW